MDTVTDFFLSDTTITGIQYLLWSVGGLMILLVLVLTACFAENITVPRSAGIAVLSLGLVGVVTVTAGFIINHNERSELNKSTQNVIYEIEDEYGIELYSTSLYSTIRHATVERSVSNTSFTVEEVIYVYEGTVYTTPMSIMYTNGRDGASISLFSPANAEAVEMVPFSPTTGEVHTEPLEELESSSE